jgi:hypothetical protein
MSRHQKYIRNISVTSRLQVSPQGRGQSRPLVLVHNPCCLHSTLHVVNMWLKGISVLQYMVRKADGVVIKYKRRQSPASTGAQSPSGAAIRKSWTGLHQRSLHLTVGIPMRPGRPGERRNRRRSQPVNGVNRNHPPLEADPKQGASAQSQTVTIKRLGLNVMVRINLAPSRAQRLTAGVSDENLHLTTAMGGLVLKLHRTLPEKVTALSESQRLTLVPKRAVSVRNP